MIHTSPHALWFQTIPGYHAQVCLVNDLYRYEIFENVTGHRVHMHSLDTLAQAKAAVLDVFAIMKGPL